MALKTIKRVGGFGGIVTKDLVLYANLREHDGTTFMSDDAYGYPLTATSGALWGMDGRTFNGTSGYIIYTVPNYRSGDSGGTIEVWFKVKTVGTGAMLVASSDIGTNTSYLQFYVRSTGVLILASQNAAGTVNIVQGTTTCADGKWHHGVLSSSGTVWSFILDGVAGTNATPVSGTNTGDWFADITLRDNISIGANVDNVPDTYMNGDIGAVRIYSRPLTLQEISRNFQIEKCRC